MAASLRFWGVDLHPSIGRFAELLHFLLGVPKAQIYVHDLTPYCPAAREFDRVSCDMPFPFAPLEAGHVRSREEMRLALEELSMLPPWDQRKANQVLRRLQANEDFRKADVVICSIVQFACSVFAAAGKTLLFYGSGLYFDHRAEGDCMWASTYRRLAECSAEFEECQEVLLAARPLVLATTQLTQEYARHILGVEVPLLVEGLPSISWRMAGVGDGLQDFRAAEPSDTVLLWPDVSLDSRWKGFKKFREEQVEAVLSLKNWFREVALAAPSSIYGKAYPKEAILQHRAAVILPYADASLTALDWYWAGVPLFLPSKSAWFKVYYQENSDGLAKRFQLKLSMLWGTLPPVDLPLCYSFNSSLVGEEEILEELRTGIYEADSSGNVTSEMLQRWRGLCEEVLHRRGEAPQVCFWFHPKTALHWLQKMWYYTAPGIQYWDTPEDLEEKLLNWPWEKTYLYRQLMAQHWEATLEHFKSGMQRLNAAEAEKTPTGRQRTAAELGLRRRSEPLQTPSRRPSFREGLWLGPSPTILPSVDTAAGRFRPLFRAGAVPYLTVIDFQLCAVADGEVRLAELFLDPRAVLETPSDPILWLQVWRHEQRSKRRSKAGPWHLRDQQPTRLSTADVGTVFSAQLVPPLVLAAGDCFGFATSGWRGLVPFDEPPLEPENGARGVCWAYGPRLARLGAREAVLAQGLALRAYAVRIRIEPRILSAAPSAPVLADPAGAYAPLCSAADVCPREPARLESAVLDWGLVLASLCNCTSGEALLGQAAGTAGACCDLDLLDRVLSALGHAKGVSCLHGALAVVASCSAKLSLRQRPRISTKLASPRLVHLGSPMRLVASPTQSDWWDLQIEPMLSTEPDLQRTYRLRGSAASFVPFPFGTQDLLWWRAASRGERLDLLTEVLLGLDVLGISDYFAFVGSICFVTSRGCAEPQPLDILVRWQDQEAVAAFAETWSASSDRRHHVMQPDRIELGVSPDPGLLSVWPGDLGFGVVCPDCSFLQIKFYSPARAKPGYVISGTRGCLWQALLPVRWLSFEELRSLGAGAVGGQEETLLFPWPADPLRVASSAAAAKSSAWCKEALQVFEPAVPLERLAPEFDLGEAAHGDLGFYDLFDLRKFSQADGLVPLADKAALKARLRAAGLPTARPLFAANDPQLPPELRELPQYAVKAVHQHHGGLGVLLMSHGRDLLTGRRMDFEEVQRWAEGAMAPQSAAPRCWMEQGARRCVNNAPVLDEKVKPGILVEELASTWDGKTGELPDEAFCFVAWGRLVFYGQMAAGTWGGYFASDGTPIFARPMKASKQIEAGGAFRAQPWPPPLVRDVARLAEATAQVVGADFIRIDIFPNGGKPLVSEVSIVTGWFGRANLQWGEVDVWLLEMLRDRWLSGYAARWAQS
ncbi:unnamed protein product [Effrenium voratum]|uniref:Uncharacterized protein n=1 Tax=Effrenium voratum TaxID=2562239 RepID=A0AA36N1X9_9DINO|nr:unnamed protein product [Effrenium voratum]